MTNNLDEARWFKSSHSGGGNDCVEVAFLAGDMVGVRDSKNPAGSVLTFTGESGEPFSGAPNAASSTVPE